MGTVFVSLFCLKSRLRSSGLFLFGEQPTRIRQNKQRAKQKLTEEEGTETAGQTQRHAPSPTCTQGEGSGMFNGQKRRASKEAEGEQDRGSETRTSRSVNSEADVQAHRHLLSLALFVSRVLFANDVQAAFAAHIL